MKLSRNEVLFVHRFLLSHLWTLRREGETIVTSSITALQTNNGGGGWGHAWAIFFGFLFNTMRACTSNHPSHLIRECHWTKQELGQVWTEATQALYLERVWMVSVICCDIWQTLTNPWCGVLYLAWQGVARLVDESFKLFLQILPEGLRPISGAVRVILSLYCGGIFSHLGTRRVTATLIALGPCRFLVRLDYLKWHRTIKRSVTLETDDSLAFVGLFWDYASSLFFLLPFLENFPWPKALHSHTSRCDNSSCIRNPTPAAICLLVSVTVHRQFVFKCTYTILMAWRICWTNLMTPEPDSKISFVTYTWPK